MGLKGKNLEKALNILYDMELNNYLMTRGIAELDWKISQLGRKTRYCHPEKEQVTAKYDGALGFGGCGAMLGALIFGLVACSTTSLFAKGSLSTVMGGLIGGGFAFGLIGVIIGAVIDTSENNKAEQYANNKYDKEMKAYNQAVAKDDARVAQELMVRKALIDNKIIRRETNKKLQNISLC